MSNDLILVFDKDGVLFDSELVKVEAFDKVFAGYPQQAENIHQYIIDTIGIPRSVRFEYICQHFLKIAEIESTAARLVQESVEMLDKKLLEIPPMKGLVSFLEQYPLIPKYVCSMAPQNEVERQLTHHGLDQYFIKLYGFPTPKKTVIQRLKEKERKRIVFLGDTLHDYEVAQETGVDFIGVQTSHFNHPFRDLDIPIISGFDQIGANFM